MDISALRDRSPDRRTLTVGELNETIKNLLENSPSLKSVSVKGEISNFKYHSSGHLYFTLKDEEGQIKAVMFRSSAQTLKFMPEDGMKVVVSATVSVYAKYGEYQLYVRDMQPDGIGSLYKAYEQLKNKLLEEGLFSDDHKKPIPKMPRRIGVITSPTGAAVRDIIKITGRRFPLAELYLYPSLVQGDGAEESLIRGLDYFENSGLCDVVIIGRGGGSIEDLLAFNGERLARKIYEMTVPVISSVGHETDFTICDFVADLRAPTPSAAAELSVPDAKELLLWLDTVSSRLCDLLLSVASKKEKDFANVVNALGLQSELLISRRLHDLDVLKNDAFHSILPLLDQKRNEFSVLCGKAEALNPLSVLSRGFALAENEKGVIRSSRELNPGDAFDVRFSDGKARVTTIYTDHTTGESK